MTNQEVNFGLDAIESIDYNTAKEILQHIKYAILDNEKVSKYVESVTFTGEKFKFFIKEERDGVDGLRYIEDDDIGEGNYKWVDNLISEYSEENARVIKRMLLRLKTLYLLVEQEEAKNLAIQFILDLPVIP
jgi:hypothetical protein